MPRPTGVIETLPAYASLMIHFDPTHISVDELKQWVHNVSKEAIVGMSSVDGSGSGTASKIVEIPVNYGGNSGPDLAIAAEITGLTPDDVSVFILWIAKHT